MKDQNIHMLREDLNLEASKLLAYYEVKHTQQLASSAFEILSKEILNIFYDLKLTNLNVNLHKQNVKAIDLAADSKKKAIQITLKGTPAKIKHTINKFNEDNLYKKYDELIIFCLYTNKSQRILQNYNNYTYTLDVFNFSDLISKVIDSNDVNKMEKVLASLEKELGPIQIKYYSETKCLENILRVINRNAIKHKMIQEGSNLKMIQALDEILKVITKGHLNNGKKITSLTIYEFEDEEIKKFLDIICSQISQIKGLIAESGGKENNEYLCVLEPYTCYEIDNLKESILDLSKEIAQKNKLKIKI